MGFNEEMMKIREQEVQAAEKGKEKPEPRVLAGSKDYDYHNMGSNKPMKGGNSWS